jgi:cytolysin-activating lysine-acyltransferase
MATKKNERLTTSRDGGLSSEDLSSSVNHASGTNNPQLDPELLKKVAQVRSHVRESFGKVVMAMMVLPRYRQQSLADLQHLVLEPLIRDRVAIAYPGGDADPLADIAGMAIWASVSDEAESRIREQIAAGVFPLRLKPEDWTSGPNNWLLDVIAPNARATANVIANFKQVVKDGSLKLHPIVAKLVDAETLQKMGATRLGGPEKPTPEAAMPEPVGTA